MNNRRQHSQLISSEDPEELFRRGCRDSMAQGGAPENQQGPRDNPNSEDRSDQDLIISLLHVPDLANTVLSKAIKDRLPVGNTVRQYIISTPKLDYIRIERLKVTLPTDELETCTNPPVPFVTRCQPTPFQENLLKGALRQLLQTNPELLPGYDWPIVLNQYLR